METVDKSFDIQIYPSLVSADLLHLGEVIAELNGHCDGYHIDIMDNHFVPNLTWGAAMVNAIKKATRLPLHVHLMVDNPSTWVERLLLDQRDTFTFHIEALENHAAVNTLLDVLEHKNWQKGIAINPSTHLQSIEPFLKRLEQVLVMSVQPGFSGQKYIAAVENKIPMLMALRTEHNYHFAVAMDGGIDLSNIGRLAAFGVTQFGIATAIFSSHDIVHQLNKLYSVAG